MSRRMHEIAELADECTVFCNGHSVASYAAGTKTDNEVVELMIGREFSAVFPARTAHPEDDTQPVLDMRNLCWTDRHNAVSLNLQTGAFTGLACLAGQRLL